MRLKDYGTPVLDVVFIGQTDVICASNYESKDVLEPDSGNWD